MRDHDSVRVWEERLQVPLTELEANFLDWLDDFYNAAMRGAGTPSDLRVRFDAITRDLVEARESAFPKANSLIRATILGTDRWSPRGVRPRSRVKNHGGCDDD